MAEKGLKILIADKEGVVAELGKFAPETVSLCNTLNNILYGDKNNKLELLQGLEVSERYMNNFFKNLRKNLEGVK